MRPKKTQEKILATQVSLVNSKKTKPKFVRKILKFRKVPNNTQADIVRLWKSYAKRLWTEMVSGVTEEKAKLKKATWKESEIDMLSMLLHKAHRQLNVKFLKQTHDVKFDKSHTIQTVDLSKIKENKAIYSAFVKRRDEHIRYFKEFPKYVKGRTQKHLDDTIEHLEHSKETVSFDAQKLANTLNLTEGMCKRHANFIARDQLGKFAASINEAQAEFVGASSYVWRTSLDSRVRHKHAQREGKTFRYDQPPEGGNPGIDYRCRCSAEAIIHMEID